MYNLSSMESNASNLFFCCNRGQAACIVGYLWDQTIQKCIRKRVHNAASNKTTLNDKD